MMTVKEIEGLLAEKVSSLGYELVEVTFGNLAKQGLTLTLFIDGANDRPITFDDLERVHNMADEALDEIDPSGDQPYTLNVSSLGLDRAFTLPRDFNKNIGNEVEIKLYRPLQIGGGKQLFGVLRGYDEAENKISVELLPQTSKKSAKKQKKTDEKAIEGIVEFDLKDVAKIAKKLDF